ncbi:MAG: hypothetical protein WC501_05455 [Candidatus Micrarchaeia archaeon]
MPVQKQMPFDERMQSLRELTKNIQKLLQNEFSILDEISFRIAITLYLSEYELMHGASKEKQQRLPENLPEVIELHSSISKEIETYFTSTGSKNVNTFISYLKLRAKQADSFIFIKKGLLKNALESLLDIVEIFKSSVEITGPALPKDFADFLNSYKITKDFFEKSSKIGLFPAEQYFELEKLAINEALNGKPDISTQKIIDLYNLMNSSVLAKKYANAKIKTNF